MSRHKQEKNHLHELEILQEHKHSSEETKKELFDHNPLLHASQPSPHAQDDRQDNDKQAPSEIDHTLYIKRSEDRERIARNTSYGTLQEHATPNLAQIFQSNLNQLMELQLQALNMMMENYTKLFSFPLRNELEETRAA